MLEDTSLPQITVEVVSPFLLKDGEPSLVNCFGTPYHEKYTVQCILSLSLSTPCDADVANLFRALVLFLRFGVASWSSIMMCIMLFGAFCVFRRDPKKTSTVDPGVHTHLNTHSAVLHSQRLCCPCWQ